MNSHWLPWFDPLLVALAAASVALLVTGVVMLAVRAAEKRAVRAGRRSWDQAGRRAAHSGPIELAKARALYRRHCREQAEMRRRTRWALLVAATVSVIALAVPLAYPSGAPWAAGGLVFAGVVTSGRASLQSAVLRRLSGVLVHVREIRREGRDQRPCGFLLYLYPSVSERVSGYYRRLRHRLWLQVALVVVGGTAVLVRAFVLHQSATRDAGLEGWLASAGLLGTAAYVGYSRRRLNGES